MAVSFPSSYTTDSSEFSNAFDINQNAIGQVLNDAGPSGPVKSLFVLIAGTANTINKINTDMTDELGNIRCSGGTTASIASTTVVTTPFFKDAATAMFIDDWDDAGKYSCYFTNNDTDPGTGNETHSIVLFSRVALASPPAGCEAAYEYYVMEGVTLSAQSSSVKKFHYNACSQELKLAIAQTSKGDSGEFSSRAEILGNVADHSFKIRSNFIDVGTGYAQHVSINGAGTSQASNETQTAHFVMGYRFDSCNSAGCTPRQAQRIRFVLKTQAQPMPTAKRRTPANATLSLSNTMHSHHLS